MPLEAKSANPVLLHFPDRAGSDKTLPAPAIKATIDSTAKVPPEEMEAAKEDYLAIGDLCLETSRALKELRTGIVNALIEVLYKLDLDLWTLARLLDERPSVIEDITMGEFDELSTETLIEYLERLRIS